MSRFQKLANICIPAVFIAMTIPAAYSQDPAHRTVIDVPYAVQVDSTVLQPGRYVIKIVNPAETSMVSIFSADEKKLIATITGVPVYRSEEAVTKAGDKTEFWFSASASVRPRPVRAWFYPGQDKGVELVNAAPAKKIAKSTER
jgi:hypothetical protein